MNFTIVRDWKDAVYHKILSSEKQETLPECPTGAFELTEADLEAVQGGWGSRFSHHHCHCSLVGRRFFFMHF